MARALVRRRFTVAVLVMFSGSLAVMAGGRPAGAATTTFTAVADAQVSSASKSKNYGTSSKLSARGGSTVERSYLKFAVSGVGGPVTAAKLRLTVTDASAEGGTVRSVADTAWTEKGITYKNAPAVSATGLSSVGPVAKGATVELDLASAVAGNGTYSFAVTSTNADVVSYSSREGATPPQLVVTTGAPPPPPSGSLSFTDVTGTAGLGILGTAYAHAAAWGDVNGDGRQDLFIGTFADKRRPDGQTPLSSRLLVNQSTGFTRAPQPPVEVAGRAGGSVFADLDNDGDLDLMVSNNRKVKDNSSSIELEPHHLYRNDDGTFTDVSATSGVRAADRNGRSVGVLDYDNDGRLDLFVVADSLTGTGTRVAKLMRNTGNLTFADTTAAAGLPTDVAGLGVAVGDANGDGWPDLVMTGGVSGSGSYAKAYLFVNRANGTFVDATPPNLAWTARGGDDWTAGAAWGDLNRDGRLDLVVTHHFESAASNPLAPRVYLNDGNDGAGNPILTELTNAGLTPIASKSPHVEVADFDNDGWADIYVSVRLNTALGPAPYVYRNSGTLTAGRPSFTAPTGSIAYYAPGGPTADYDGDGRLDVFLEGLSVDVAPSLLRNVTAGAANWLQVKVTSATNTMGLGARVNVYRAGQLGQAAGFIGAAEINTGNGFSSASPAIAHFGLGGEASVDLEVKMPFGGPRLTRTGVAADQQVTVSG